MKLKLNTDNTEFIIIGDKNTIQSHQNLLLYYFIAVNASTGSKNLDVTFASENTFYSHVGKVCSVPNYHLRES